MDSDDCAGCFQSYEAFVNFLFLYTLVDIRLAPIINGNN